jgi:hypothetical protein
MFIYFHPWSMFFFMVFKYFISGQRLAVWLVLHATWQVYCLFSFILSCRMLARKSENNFRYIYIQLFQLRLSTSNVEKSNTSAKGCWESLTNEWIFKAIPSSLSRSNSTFTLCSWTTLIEIAVYTRLLKNSSTLVL